MSLLCDNNPVERENNVTVIEDVDHFFSVIGTVSNAFDRVKLIIERLTHLFFVIKTPT